MAMTLATHIIIMMSLPLLRGQCQRYAMSATDTLLMLRYLRYADIAALR